jgi:hypothetical protein
MRSFAKILSAALLLGLGSLAFGGPRMAAEAREQRRLIGIVKPTSALSLAQQFQERLLLLTALAAGEVPAGSPDTISDVPDPIGSKPNPPPEDGEPTDPRATTDEDKGSDRAFTKGP